MTKAKTSKKNRSYPWAVVGASGKLLREQNDRRAIYRTRDAARMSARVLKGRVVRRADVAPVTPKAAQAQQAATMLGWLSGI